MKRHMALGVFTYPPSMARTSSTLSKNAAGYFCADSATP